MTSRPSPETALEALWKTCHEADWSGWDPFDGLMATHWPVPLLRLSRPTRLVLIQALKRAPFNLRPLFGVPKLRNPKALALALESVARLAAQPSWNDRSSAEISRLSRDLVSQGVPFDRGTGWGYPFDWQSRAFWFPRGTPTVVCTGFVVRAFDRALSWLAAEERNAVEDAMRSAGRFVLEDLNRIEDENGFCWSYSPLDRSCVVNASLLGAETVARVARLEKSPDMLRQATGTLRWCLARQSADGGWAYGEAGHHQWEDAFHTGFNIASLQAVRESALDLGIEPDELVPIDRLQAAIRHYSANFFDPDGRPWYFRHTPWPIDAHSAGVGILTLAGCESLAPGTLEQARRVAHWTIDNMWIADQSRFAYQVRPRRKVSIDYLRWSQAWMVRGLSELVAVSSS